MNTSVIECQELNKVDDGTGVLSCISWTDHTDIKLGDLVTVKGKIQDFRNKRQLNISQIFVEKDPNMELVRTLITISNHDIYDRPRPQFHYGIDKIPKVAEDSIDDQVYTKNNHVIDTDLSKFILAWIKENHSVNGSFSYNQILQESKILNYGVNVLKFQFNDDNPSHSRLTSLVKKSMLDLSKQGSFSYLNNRTDISY